jgi:Protein of unknown function (DUF3375)
MSDIEGEFARVRGAFEKPTLKLLDRKWAPFILAVFKSSFSRDQQSIPAARLHTHVDTYLSELKSVGVVVPPDSGRGLCLKWMTGQWLYRSLAESGEEQYSLTSHALEAMTLVDNMSKDRALISESRLTTILATVRQWATEANPDREDRIRRLDMGIEEMTKERDRLADGGDIVTASDDKMIDGYANMINLIGQLPSDFKRVEESVEGMHRQIISDFREEERPIGEILGEYLRKTDTLMDGTPEGRAFVGAFTLLRNDGLMLDLKTDLEAILAHPFAEGLTATEQREFRGTVLVLRQGLEKVLTRRQRLTKTLREHIENHDVVKDRELESLLKNINQGLAKWMESAGGRSSVPVKLMPDPPSVRHLQERFYDPKSDAPPPPLEDVSEDAPEPLSLDEIRKQGGPLTDETRQALVNAFLRGDAVTIGGAFNRMGQGLRRPVEVFGLLDLASRIDVLAHATGVESFEAIRSDGSRRTLTVPRITLTEHDTSLLADLENGSPS